MNISIHMILEELREYNPVSEINFNQSFTSYKMLEEDIEAEDILYISDVTKFVSVSKKSKKNTFILIDPLNILLEFDIPKTVNIIRITENISLNTLINRIISLFKKYDDFELKIKSSLFSGINLESILVFVYKYLGVELFLHDSKGNVLFRNSNSYKYYPQSIVVSKTIRDGNKALGSLALMKSKILSEDYQLSVFHELGKMLDKVLDQYFNNKKEAFNDLSKLILEHLTINSLFDNELVNNKLRTLGWTSHDTYKLIIIQSSKFENIESIVDYLNDQYKKDTIIVKQDNKYIVLINLEQIDKKVFIKELRLIQEPKKDLKIIISRNFNDIFEIKDQYQFLLNLISKMNDQLIDMDEDVIKILLHIAKKTNYDVYINTEIKKLKAYDLEHDGDLVETLYAYIAYERSLVNTAEKLNVHRNTVVYRVGKINEIINLDLDSPTVRFHSNIAFTFGTR